MISIDNVEWFLLRDISKELGVVNSRCIAGRVRKMMPQDIQKRLFPNARGQNRQSDFVTKAAVDWIKATRRNTQVHGTVYGFSPIACDKVFKFGRTFDWEKRTYMGFNKPKHMVLLKEVADQQKAEKTLLRFFREHNNFTQRLDLGLEWFETELTSIEVKNICSSIQF